MLFNESQKLKFIESVTNGAYADPTMISVFNASAHIEQKNGDICSWDEITIGDFLANQNIANSRTATHWYRILRNYCHWCVDSGVENATTLIDNVDPKFLMNTDSFAQKFVCSAQSLLGFLNEYFPVEENQKRYTAWAWLTFAFSGLQEQDALCITKEHYKDGIIRFGINEYEIPAEVKPAIEQGFSLCSEKPIVQNWLNAFKSGYASKYLRSMAAKKPEYLYKYSDIYKSGLFSRVYAAEKQGMDPYILFTVEAKAQSATKEYTGYGNSKQMKHSIQSRAALARAGLLSDYDMWKAAFGLKV